MMSLVDRIANGEKVTSRPRKRKHLSNGRVSSRDFVRPEAAERGMTRPLKPIPLFEQGPGESDGRFLRRVEKLTKDAFAHLSDRVQFGDVVQRPPELKVAPKKAPVDDERSRPGRKSLLLKRLFTDAQAGARSSTAPKSLHQRAALEEERQRVVAAYRQLRQQKIERAAAAAGRL
ncbi:coiled-coil domain-containing protein 137-like isoform X4 [Amphibalanus amphitrite]|nr:coiled-coil domain-containing protein 137-like isoform X4 [Amphibalanus amphitrite]